MSLSQNHFIKIKFLLESKMLLSLPFNSHIIHKSNCHCNKLYHMHSILALVDGGSAHRTTFNVDCLDSKLDLDMQLAA